MNSISRARYRKNVAIVVVGQSGRLLAGERADIPGAWQIPQGGIEEGETPEQAMQRELQEEIGASPLRVIAQMPDSLFYDWPENLHRDGFTGQEQFYFLVEIDESAELALGPIESPEFRCVEWISAEEFFSRLSGFKKSAYLAGVGYFVDNFPELFSVHQTER